MHWQQIIKVIGRGKHHARDLDQEQARLIYQAVLAEEIDPLQLGALLIAFRVKGESQTELSGFYQAVQQQLTIIEAQPDVPTIVIPSYNGARRQPNLTPLLILLLCRCGFSVFCHMTHNEPERITTADICRQLEMPMATNRSEAETMLHQQRLALITVDHLYAPLAKLLDLRWQLGVRNSAHSVVKLITPVVGDKVIQLSSVSHPEYLPKIGQLFAQQQVNALISQGCEGEIYANPRRVPAMDYIDSVTGSNTRLIDAESESAIDVIDDRSASACAQWFRQVIGHKQPVPASIRKQLACCFMASGQAASLPQALSCVADCGY